jgi:hypothetical protein
MSDASWARWGLAVTWTTALFAVGRYLACLGLRYDEARVVINLLDRDYAGLLGRLDHAQAGPVGFLWLHKAMIDFVSFSEWGLRLPTMLAGVAVPLLMWSAVRKLTGVREATVCALLVWAHPQLGLFVGEVKQYSFDCVAVAGLLWLWSRLPTGRLAARWWTGLAILGVLMPWWTHGGLFGLAGFGLALAWRQFERRSGAWEWIKLLGLGLLWGAAVGLVYFVQLRTLTGEAWAREWWAIHFAPLPPGQSQAVVVVSLQVRPVFERHLLGLCIGTGVGNRSLVVVGP